MKKSNNTPGQKNFFQKHKILTVILFFLGLSIFASALSGGEDPKAPDTGSPVVTTPAPKPTTPASTPAPTPTPTPAPAPTPPEPPKVKTYGDGMYMVGTDIEPGLYRVILNDTFMKMGYIERAKDVSMELKDIIANIVITGDGYVAIKDTDKVVKTSGVELMKIDYATLPIDIKTEVEDGIYLVNKDLKPGTYKVVVTDSVMKMGYVERAKNVAMGIDDIIGNNIFQGDGYVKILEKDYAVKVQGAKLIYQP